MGDMQFNGTPEEWDALVKKNIQTTVKLYTEEQVIRAINLALDSPSHSHLVVDYLTPIELPSDEEMRKELFYQKQIMNPYPTIEYTYTAYENGFMDCANLIIDKILNK